MSDAKKTLKVTVTKAGEPFLTGTFDVADVDYQVVKTLLSEAKLSRAQAAAMLAGYMHAQDVGQLTEEMGKLSMLATVFMIEAGETDIIIPLEEAPGLHGGAHRG